MQRIVLLVILGIFTLGLVGTLDNAYAETFTSFQTGDWNSAGTWRNGMNNPGVPGVADDKSINLTHTVTISGPVTNSGLISLGGTLIIESTLTNNGFFDGVITKGIQSFGGTITVTSNGIVQNNGLYNNLSGTTTTINFGGQFFNNFASGNAHLHNEGATITVRGTLTNNGDIHQLTNGIMTIHESLINSGPNAVFDNRGGATLKTVLAKGINNNSGGTIINESLIEISFASLNNTATINNNSGGTIKNEFSDINNNSGGTINNNILGTIKNEGGNITNEDGGTIINKSGSLINTSLGGTFNNSGEITNLSGGTIKNTGSVGDGLEADANFNNRVGGKVNNSGLILSEGNSNQTITTIRNFGIIDNLSGGNITVNGGEIENISGGAIFNLSGGIITNDGGEINNSGIMENNSGGTINNNGALDNNDTINNAGLITNAENNTIDNSGSTINNSGNILNCGTYTGALPSGNQIIACTITENTTLSSNLTIPVGITLTVNPGAVLTVNPGVILTVNEKVIVKKDGGILLKKDSSMIIPSD